MRSMRYAVLGLFACAEGTEVTPGAGGGVKAMLGDASVELIGINPGGDVDGNDKLYVAFGCAP